MSITVSLTQSMAVIAAIQSVAPYRPADDQAPPEHVEISPPAPPSKAMVVSFKGRALIPAAGGRPDDAEVIAPTPGVFHVWIDEDGELLTARHTNAGRLYPWPGPKVRMREAVAAA